MASTFELLGKTGVQQFGLKNCVEDPRGDPKWGTLLLTKYSELPQKKFLTTVRATSFLKTAKIKTSQC